MILDYRHFSQVNLVDWSKHWPNFSPSEMADRSDGRLRLTVEFMYDLQDLREEFDFPMRITSACRTTAYNAAVEGKSGSFHICDAENRAGANWGCLAVDVWLPDGPFTGRLWAMAWDFGWSVGWNQRKRFLHLDRRIDIGWRQTAFPY